jgi:hypothetical protein
MLKKFVYWTGMSDFVVGLATWGGAVGVALADPPVLGQFVPLVTLGTFLLMAAALLVWSSHDMATRAPVMFWQGLVRLSAISAVVYAVPHQLAYTWEYGLLAIDGPIGLTYVIGAMKVTGCSFVELLQCKTTPGGRTPPAAG